jgi:hypothetical protein
LASAGKLSVVFFDLSKLAASLSLYDKAAPNLFDMDGRRLLQISSVQALCPWSHSISDKPPNHDGDRSELAGFLPASSSFSKNFALYLWPRSGQKVWQNWVQSVGLSIDEHPEIAV